MSSKPRFPVLKILLILLCLALMAGTAYNLVRSQQLLEQEVTLPTRQEAVWLPEPSTEPSTEPPATQPQPEHVVATATIASQGDLLMHKPIFEKGSLVNQGDGSYDFSSIFRYIQPYLEGYDLALANLETTLGGDDFVYQGWPMFNCPDPIVDAVVGAGYDLLIQGNNHSYDTLMPGLLRTLEKLREAGLVGLGVRADTEEPRYHIAQVNGINIGMVSYTFATTRDDMGRPRLNGNAPVEEPQLVNWFIQSRQEELMAEITPVYQEMLAAGAEATVLYIHWGDEYKIDPNHFQKDIAQKMCDLGFDVIVGGHPHVVQPMDLLQSTQDPDHRTVILYSMGNAVSNQRIEKMNLHTGHTEDGLVFSVTFEKYSDGTVYLAQAEVLPTWVNLHKKNGGAEYNILPLEDARREEWATLFDLTEEELTDCQKSWQRTMDLVGQGLTACNEYLAQEKQAREEAYLAAVQ